MPMPPQLNDSSKTYPEATLICCLQSNFGSLFTIECSELRFEKHLEGGENRVLAEFRKRDRGARVKKEYFGGSLRCQLLVIVDGWGHPLTQMDRPSTGRKRIPIIQINLDPFEAPPDPCEKYLEELTRRGVTIIADFRDGTTWSPPTPLPIQPHASVECGEELHADSTKCSSLPDMEESGEGRDSLLADPIEDFEDMSADEVPETSGEVFREGTLVQRNINTYERNPKARKACIERYGCACQICGIDFSRVYPGIGDGYIHVHHLVPMSSIKKEYRLDPIEDLRPVCPNCHEMLHQRKPPYTLEEVKAIMRNKEG